MWCALEEGDDAEEEEEDEPYLASPAATRTEIFKFYVCFISI